MSYLVIANADAGSTDRIDRATATLSEDGPCEVVWTKDRGDIDEALGRRPAAVPVVAGGDGSIHLVANRLDRTGQLERAVGILPMGTGNDLARGLGLPFDPADAARRVIAGEPQDLPLLEAPAGELGVNNAHVGLGVAAARRGTEWKDRLGEFAYTAGSLAEGLLYDGVDVSVAVDGDTVHAGPALAVLVMIGPSAGGGFRPLPDVDVADPVLDVVVIVGDGSAERVAAAFSALRGDFTDASPVVHRRGEAIRVKSGGEPWELDGEFRDWNQTVDIHLSDRSWSVLH